MDQAAQDLQTDKGHRRNAWIWGALLLSGLAWGGWSLARHGPKAGELQLSAWLDGRAGTALNKGLRLPAQSSLETGQAALRYRLLGDTGAQVALGCPQWMFYRDGLRPQPGVGAAPFEARQRLLRHWTRQLQDKGIATLVVAVPDKSRIEADHLCGLPVAPVMLQRLDLWQQRLQADGIAFADLRPALQAQEQTQPVFFRTDVHMNAEGARAAALAVARAALPLLGGQRGSQAFEESAPGPLQPLPGDLLALAGLADAPAGWRPQRDEIRPRPSPPCAAAACWTRRRPCRCCWPAAPTACAAISRHSWAARWAMKSGTSAWMAASSAAPWCPPSSAAPPGRPACGW